MARKPKKQNRGRQRSASRGRSLGVGGPAGAAPGEPFPTVPPHLRGKAGVVTSIGGAQKPTPSAPRVVLSQPRQSIITGGTTDERRSVQQAESALDQSGGSRRRAGESNFERFCEIKIIKGKRKRVCRDKKITKKKKKTQIKPKKRTSLFEGFLK